MTTRYLLPCPCGKKTPIEARQAGEQVHCECGAALDVPRLRELTRLERDASQQVAVRSAWDLRKGVILLGGLVTAVSLIFSAWFYSNTRQAANVFNSGTDAQQRIRHAINSMNWEDLRHGLFIIPNTELSAAVNEQKLQRLIANGVVGVAGLGLLTSLGAFLFLRPAKSR